MALSWLLQITAAPSTLPSSAALATMAMVAAMTAVAVAAATPQPMSRTLPHQRVLLANSLSAQ